MSRWVRQRRGATPFVWLPLARHHRTRSPILGVVLRRPGSTPGSMPLGSLLRSPSTMPAGPSRRALLRDSRIRWPLPSATRLARPILDAPCAMPPRWWSVLVRIAAKTCRQQLRPPVGSPGTPGSITMRRSRPRCVRLVTCCGGRGSGRWCWPTTTRWSIVPLRTGPVSGGTARTPTCCFPVGDHGSCSAASSPMHRYRSRRRPSTTAAGRAFDVLMGARPPPSWRPAWSTLADAWPGSRNARGCSRTSFASRLATASTGAMTVRRCVRRIARSTAGTRRLPPNPTPNHG